MNKTFNDLKKGDKIYVVATDLPKLTVSELLVLGVKIRNCGGPSLDFTVMPMNGELKNVRTETIYYTVKHKERDYMGGGICWHTNEEAARNTIKETIKNRINKKQQTIREAKRTIEKYKKLLKNYV